MKKFANGIKELIEYKPAAANRIMMTGLIIAALIAGAIYQLTR